MLPAGSGRRPAVEPAWVDAWGRRRTVSPATVAALLAAMGDDADAAADPVRVVAPGEALPAAGLLVLEDGTELGLLDRLPVDLPLGYHRLQHPDGEQLLVCAPPSCHLPDGLRVWGWSVQLATTRSRRSWGIGDLRDLRRLAAWSSGQGAGLLQVSPLGAPTPGPIPEASPYFPGTRRFRNPLHLAVDAVPGAGLVAAELAPLAAEAQALNAERLVDRVRVLSLKQRGLALIWGSGAGATEATRTGVEGLRSDLGPALRQWATYAALAEQLGADWRRWPEELRDADAPAVQQRAAGLADRIAFHEWVQWLIDEQLRAAAAEGPGLLQDLPIGFDPGGFDAWSWQAHLALGASMGAPPDLLALDGQDWGLPPFVPHRLRAAGYQPFRDTLRAVMRHAGGLRIDHVAGLFRGWWVPGGRPSAEGAYVRFPWDELLAVLALESVRAGAWVVGEDLGTIEAGVRDELSERAILGMRLVYFQDEPPAAYPWRAQAVITTHDLPTVAGLWSGHDLADQVRAGITPDAEGMADLRRRLQSVTRMPTDAPAREVILAAHAALAAAPSAVICATLEDALAVEERVNLPGTVAPQRDNWSIALPRPIEELEQDPFAARLADTLAAGRAGS